MHKGGNEKVAREAGAEGGAATKPWTRGSEGGDVAQRRDRGTRNAEPQAGTRERPALLQS